VRSTAACCLTLLVVLGALAAEGGATRASDECAKRMPRVRAVLPASVAITTSNCSFEIARDGRVRRVSTDPLPVQRSFEWYPSTGVWFRLEHGHLVVGRWRTRVWTSHGRFPVAYEIGAIALGSSALAVSYGNRNPTLYIAPLGGRERRIARGEFPLGWIGDGLYTRLDRGAQLLLRGETGDLRKTLARRVYTYTYDQTNGRLYFLAHGTLVRADGGRRRQLASLADLGLSAGRYMQVQPLGRLVALRDTHRLVVLRSDGSLFAATQLPRGRARADGISSSIVAAPDAAVVAFTATRGNTASGSSGNETVYLLRAGADAAIPVHRERIDFAVCERGADLAWHDHWLLYSASEGNLAAVDTTNAHRAVELGAVIRKLPDTSGDEGNLDFSARWSVNT